MRWAASQQRGVLPCLPGVLSLAENCREEKERPQRRKKPHRVTARQEENMQEKEPGEESLLPPAKDQISQTDIGCLGKCLCRRTRVYHNPAAYDV